MRFSFSSPDETPRRELKIRRAAEYFQLSSRCFIWWWNTASQVWYITSSMRFSVSSPEETPRRELKIRRAAEYFWRTSRSIIWWWNTLSNAWYYFTNKMILEGEIKDAEMSSFSSDFQTLIKHSFVFSLRIIDGFEKVGSNFWECGWKPVVLPFNWILLCR